MHGPRALSSLATMAGRLDMPASGSSVVDEVLSLIPDLVDDDERPLVEAFAKTYLRRLPQADLPDLAAEELLAEVRDLLAFIELRESGVASVRVFEPTLAGCGYETHGSVLQVAVEVGPFLVDSLSAAAG